MNRLMSVVMLVSLIAASPWASTAQDNPHLVEFLSPTELSTFSLSSNQGRTLEAIHSDPAAFDVQIGRAAPHTARDARAFSIVLPAPAGSVNKVTATFDNLIVEQLHAHDYTLFSQGEIDDSFVSLEVINLDVLGTIQYKGTIYQVHPLGNGLTAVYRYDVNHLQDHPDDYEDFLKKQSERRSNTRVLQLPEALKSVEPIIDVLVVYTDRARNEAGNIEAHIRHTFRETKRIYTNSRIVPSLRLVHSYLAHGYQEHRNIETDLKRLRKRGDGYIDDVHQKREEYKADLVVLLVGRGSACGIGYLYADEDWAFSVVRQNCAAVNYTFAHEIGHNQGAQHDPDTDENKYFSYGHGFCNYSSGWRTVMSYNAGGGCKARRPYISNPNAVFRGAPTGDPAVRNNTRVINETAQRVAYFRSLDCNGWTDWRGQRAETKTFFDLASAMDIARCLNAGKNIEARDEEGATPLHKAVYNDNPEALQALLNAGADGEAKLSLDGWDQGTSLHLAAGGGLTRIVTVLLSNGASMAAVDEWGGTPLHSAARAVQSSGSYWTSVRARSHSIENIRALVNAGAMLEARNKSGRTPLHELLRNSSSAEEDASDHIEETEVVADAIGAMARIGADLEARDKDGRTPLHLAATNNRFEDATSILTLIDVGARLSARDSLGKTPLHRAAEFDAQKRRKVTRCKPSRANPTRSVCDTRMRPRAAIHVRNATAAIHALLNAGADPVARTKDGKTPFQLIADDSPIHGTEAYRLLAEAHARGPE